MIRRNRRGRFEASRRWEQIVGYSILGGILLAVILDYSRPIVVVNEAQAKEVSLYPREVLVGANIEWNKERIEKEIRTVFHEEPNTAVAIFKCESGLDADIKGPTNDYGLTQIHAPSWDKKAKQLGYEDYRTDVQDNLAMARYLYDSRGNFNDWVCYTKGLHRKYL